MASFVYAIFNSDIVMIIHLICAMRACIRFFGVMKSHYKLIAEIAQFNTVVGQSRKSLDYMNSKVSEAMKEIEGDIGKELYVTHNLTKISSKIALILRRFQALEEGVVELVRMEHNTQSVKIETPTDINLEVKKIIINKTERNQLRERPKTPKKSKIANDSPAQNPVSKFSAVQSLPRSKDDYSDFSVVRAKGQKRNSQKLASSVVKLLSENNEDTINKPIGFRPSWKCDT